ncbi:MAG: molybdopterin-binding protein [Tissierellia bacterium]|nr:molybdopterin-binding protein [Tissierellia bacterium]
MKTVKVQDAIGQVLCHDMTQIIPGVSKGARFRKGHIIKEEDIPVLLSMGKENIFIYEYDESKYHENEAAKHLGQLGMGENIYMKDPVEGKVDLFSSVDGLLKVNVEILNKINSIPEIMMATKLTNTPIKKDGKIAGTRVIPLVINREPVDKAVVIGKDQELLKILPYQNLKAGLVTTGNEVYYGRIEDKFTDVIRNKMKRYGMTEIGQENSTDDKEMIKEKIELLIEKGAEIIFCSGGMSVDPDDNTPGAIGEVADHIITYGSPVLPGAMFMLAYLGEIPIVGLPGCVMYSGKTIFDLILPRLAAKDKIQREEICDMGHGGLL